MGKIKNRQWLKRPLLPLPLLREEGSSHPLCVSLRPWPRQASGMGRFYF